MLAHYGLEARTIHMASPNENGDIESSNGGLKRAVEQHLLLRGSRDFESIAVYEAFLFGIMEKRNAGRQEKLAEELAVMKPLAVVPWPPCANSMSGWAKWHSAGRRQWLHASPAG